MATGTALDWINAGSNLLGAVGSLNAPPPAPGFATSGGPLANKADVDFSGFTVATGQARATGATVSKSSADGLAGAVPSSVGAALQSVGLNKSALWIGAGVVGVAVLWRILKK